jgi:hypothetical protein
VRSTRRTQTPSPRSRLAKKCRKAAPRGGLSTRSECLRADTHRGGGGGGGAGGAGGGRGRGGRAGAPRTPPLYARLTGLKLAPFFGSVAHVALGLGSGPVGR